MLLPLRLLLPLFSYFLLLFKAHLKQLLLLLLLLQQKDPQSSFHSPCLQLAASYSREANFVTVYLAEAHPADDGHFKTLYVDIDQHK